MSCVQKKEGIVKIKIKKIRGEGSGEMCTKNGSYCCEREKKVSLFFVVFFFFFFGGGGVPQGSCK